MSMSEAPKSNPAANKRDAMPTKPVDRASLPWKDWPAKDLDRVIQMAWEDRTPFEAIEWQFGLKENDVRSLMRRSLKRKSFEMWRKRVKGMGTKHLTKRPDDVGRFRAPGQRP